VIVPTPEVPSPNTAMLSPMRTEIVRPVGFAPFSAVAPLGYAAEPSEPAPVITAVNDSPLLPVAGRAVPAAFLGATTIVAAATAAVSVVVSAAVLSPVTTASEIAEIVSPTLRIDVA